MLMKCVEKRLQGKDCLHYAKYGIGCLEVEAIAIRANGRCEVCGIAAEDTKRGELVLDHEHGPQNQIPVKIRGLLCDWCNTTVMAQVDGVKPWGPNRSLEAAARRYAANAWHLTAPAFPLHPLVASGEDEVRYAFATGRSASRLHRTVAPWINGGPNRTYCGEAALVPAAHTAVNQHRECLRCVGAAAIQAHREKEV